MARDLTKEQAGRNGRVTSAEVAHVELDAGEEPGLDDDPRVTSPTRDAPEPPRVPMAGDPELLVRQARRLVQEAAAERLGASVVRAIWDAAQMLDPVTRIVMARVLAVLALVAASGLTAYTLALTTTWERAAALGAFLLFSAWTIAYAMRHSK